MSNFGKQMEGLAERLASARGARQQAAAARGRWLASFQAGETKARNGRAADFAQTADACRQHRKIRLSELFSRTRHLLGRFRIEHQERTARTLETFKASGNRRAEELGRLMGSCRQRRLNWRGELERANMVWNGHQESGPRPAARDSSTAKSSADRSEPDRRMPASHAQSGTRAAPSISPQPAHRAHQGHKRGGAR